MSEVATQWQIRPARGSLAQRVRARFQVPFPDEPRLLLFCLTAANGARVQGYGALFATRGTDDRRCFVLRWELTTGVPVAALELLLSTLVERARTAGAEVVRCLRLADEAGDTGRLLMGLGFVAVERLEIYRPAYHRVLDRAQRICRAAERRGLRPVGTTLDWLRPELVPTVRTLLHCERILGVDELDLKLLPDAAESIDRERSTLILRDGELVAVMLVAPLADGHSYAVPARWVHPDLRNGWANAALLATSCERTRALGLTHVEFAGNTARHDETRRLAERLGAEISSRGARFALELDRTPGPASAERNEQPASEMAS